MDRCTTCPPHRTTFCPVCRKASPNELAGVRLMGFVGVQHSTSPRIEQFFNTGDPACLTSR